MTGPTASTISRRRYDPSNRKPGQPKEAPVEPLKRAISGAMKAIARKPEMEIVFAADKPSLVGRARRLPGAAAQAHRQ